MRESQPCRGPATASRKRVPHAFNIAGWTGDETQARRVVFSMFDHDDVKAFLDAGYLLVPDVLNGEFVDLLRDSLERHRRQDFGDLRESAQTAGSHFQGQYVLDILLRDAVMARLLEPEPIMDTVRSLLGPCIALFSCTGLVAYPGALRSGTDWHADYLLTTIPSPPMPTVTPRVGCMIYLDDLTPESGPTYVVPGSHRLQETPNWKPDAEPASQVLLPTAGSVLFYDSALWHRGGQMRDSRRMRRSIILTLVAGGNRTLREPRAKPERGTFHRELLERAEREQDQGLLELLSRQWYG